MLRRRSYFLPPPLLAIIIFVAGCSCLNGDGIKPPCACFSIFLYVSNASLFSFNRLNVFDIAEIKKAEKGYKEKRRKQENKGKEKALNKFSHINHPRKE